MFSLVFLWFLFAFAKTVVSSGITCYGKPTDGVSDSLSFLYYVTAPATIYYTLFPSNITGIGGEPEPKTIKTWVLNNNVDEAHKQHTSLVAAKNSFIVEKPEKVEFTVDGLQPSTSYNIYFASEVTGSNGIFGAVIKLTNISTHPTAPVLTDIQATPLNGSSTSAQLTFKMNQLGLVYYSIYVSGVVPEDNKQDSQNNDFGDIILVDKTMAQLHNVAKGVVTLDSYEALNDTVIVTLQGLLPRKMYDIFYVTEALHTGGVRGQLRSLRQAFMTHATSPSIALLSLRPLDGESDALELKFILVEEGKGRSLVNPNGVDNAIVDDDLSPYDIVTYFVLFDSNTSFTDKSYILNNITRLKYADEPLEDEKSVVASGTIFIRYPIYVDDILSHKNIGKVEKYYSQNNKNPHSFPPKIDNLLYDIAPEGVFCRLNISDLVPNKAYDIGIVAEVKDSNGVFGAPAGLARVHTHAKAPEIHDISIHPVNGSDSILEVTGNLSRPGSVHYLAMKKSPRNIYNHYHSEKVNINSRAKFWDLMSQSKATDEVHRKGRFDVFQAFIGENATFKHSFSINLDDLEPASEYEFYMVAETQKSNGVYGELQKYDNGYKTHDRAPKITVSRIQAVYNSTDSVEIIIDGKEDRETIVHICIRNATLDNNGSNAHKFTCDDERTLENKRINHDQLILGNLTANTTYEVYLYTEDANRNGVHSDSTMIFRVKTHSFPPVISHITGQAVNGSSQNISISLQVSHSNILLHYGIIRVDADMGLNLAKNLLHSYVDKIREKETDWGRSYNTFQRNHGVANAAHNTKKFNRTISFYASDSSNNIEIGELDPNTTYSLFILSEAVEDPSHSQKNGSEHRGTGVLGDVKMINITTHDIPPKIIKAIALPIDGSTDSIMLVFNISRPGIIHYSVTDMNGEDPLTIQNPKAPMIAAINKRGLINVSSSDIIITPWNRTEEPEPTPDVFAVKYNISGLAPDTTYRVSFCTETYGSYGLFGEFLTPILVRTHDIPPVIEKNSFSVSPAPGCSTSINIRFRLNKHGALHYILIYRSSLRESNIESKMEKALNITVNYRGENIPDGSTYPVHNITGRIIKEAKLKVLGKGIVRNDTIFVSREDVSTGKVITKTLNKLVHHSIYDFCYVSETDNSYGVFNWDNRGNHEHCIQVRTHADYTNWSRLHDDISVQPLKKTTHGLNIRLYFAKSSTVTCQHVNLNMNDVYDDDDKEENDSTKNAFGKRYCRVPTYILMRTTNSEHNLGQYTIGKGNKHILNAEKDDDESIRARGIITNIASENSTHLILEENIVNLEPDTTYALYWASETFGSLGVFTSLNPYPGQLLEKKEDHVKGIIARTFPLPPTLRKVQLEPWFGNINGLIMHFDFYCSSCTSGIIHVFVWKQGTPIKTTNASEYISCLSSQTTSTLKDCSEEIGTEFVTYEKLELQMTSGNKDNKQVASFIRIENIKPNETYDVRYATETGNKSGIISGFSPMFPFISHNIPPSITYLTVSAKPASTTELQVRVALDTPGLIHIILGPSGSLANVSSPYDITNKRPADKYKAFIDWKDPKKLEGTDLWRRTIRFESLDFNERGKASNIRTETFGYLTAGTSYDVFLVAENPHDKGIFSDNIVRFYNVSTFRQAPFIMSHGATPKTGSPFSLILSYRINAPGLLHFVVTHNHVSKNLNISESLYQQMEYASHLENGNRIGLNEQILIQRTIVTNDTTANTYQTETIDHLPFPGGQYNIFMVTESLESQGVFGAIARIYNIRTYGLPPVILSASMEPTDARYDALNLTVSPSAPCVVHYTLTFDSIIPSSASDEFITGQFFANGTTAVTIQNLEPDTPYFAYLKTETAKSNGIVSNYSETPLTSRTHAAPPITLDEVDCSGTPNCTELHREECWIKSGTCGECKKGFIGIDGPANILCLPDSIESLSNTTNMTSSISATTPKILRLATFSKKKLKLSSTPQNATNSSIQPKMVPKWKSKVESNPCPKDAELVGPKQCQCKKGYKLNDDNNACIKIDISCPPNASPSGPKSCECNDGFYLNSMLNACVKTFSEL